MVGGLEINLPHNQAAFEDRAASQRKAKELNDKWRSQFVSLAGKVRGLREQRQIEQATPSQFCFRGRRAMSQAALL